MLDVIPSEDASRFGSGDQRKPHFAKASRGRSSKNILKVTWKLPARLRKPIRQQLSAERKRKRAKILGGFARRRLMTQPLTSEANVGAEHHTADIYRERVPSLRLVAPPYVGAAAKERLRTSAFPSRERITQPASSEGTGLVQQPKRRLKLPFSINLIPKGLLGEKEDVLNPALVLNPKQGLGKKKVSLFNRNIAILLVGCLISSTVMWNLQGLGRTSRALTSLRGSAEAAAQNFVRAESALAQSDFSQSESAFADAATLLSATRQELDNALAASRLLVEVLDVSGTVRSGERFLSAGEALAQAGTAVSRGLLYLASARAVSDETAVAASAPTLVDVIMSARDQFRQGLDSLSRVEQDLTYVHSSFLPDSVRQTVEQLQEAVPKARSFLMQFVNQSDVLLTLLGSERARDYLLLFANNHELRPVGGFLGSIGLLHVDRGMVERIDVDTVYDGDGQLKEFIAPPEPLRQIVNRWYLRDSNWFVDFPVSAAKVAEFFEKEGGPTVDGVLLLTPDVIGDLLYLTGPIEMPAYGVTVTAENFTAVTQQEVTYEYDRSLNRPKQFLADLTPVLLSRILQEQGQESLRFVSALTGSLAKKDLLLFFRDEKLQQRVQDLGWSATVPADVPGLVYVNNANIGGHKSDQFIEQEIDYRLEVGDEGRAEVVLTIRRTHRGPSEGENAVFPPGENPAVKDNIVFQRVLVPEGSQLLEAHGFTAASHVPRLVAPETYLDVKADGDVAEWQRRQTQDRSGTILGHEAGYAFFGNWMVTKPGETTVGLYRYLLPTRLPTVGVVAPVARFATYIVKQPGEKRTNVRVSHRLPETVKLVATAPQGGVTPVGDHEFTYRGQLGHDLIVGSVFEKR